MSGYQLCLARKARRPYYIESISTNIYTIEELCFYLYHNIYLIDETIMNEQLCDWIKNELKLLKLYRKLYEQLEQKTSIGSFILPVFKEIGYLSHAEFRKLQEKINQIEIQPEDMRKKMKADYLVNFGKYENAIHEYYQILQKRNPGNVGVKFYASVLNNMGAAYSRMFLFEETADCLWQSYNLVRSNEVYHHYLAALPLFLTEEKYRERLEELKVPQELSDKLEEQNRDIRKLVHEKAEGTEWTEEACRQQLARWKKEYMKGISS